MRNTVLQDESRVTIWRVAYADPPYMGCEDYYPEHQAVDHVKLLEELVWEYDAWALSCSSPSLGYLLNVTAIKDQVRVGAWVKPFASFKPNVNPAYAWEPVIYRVGKSVGRKRTRQEPTIRDWVSANITMQKGVVGAKPAAFCFWLFKLLNMRPYDEFHDLYPGSGIVSKCWDSYRAQMEGRPTILTLGETAQEGLE